VCNLADCIKVAVDFVSPENVARCARLTEEFRALNLTQVWKEDVLQLRAMMWYAWQSCGRAVEARERGSEVEERGARGDARSLRGEEHDARSEEPLARAAFAKAPFLPAVPAPHAAAEAPVVAPADHDVEMTEALSSPLSEA
jgi:hypothetical protein